LAGWSDHFRFTALGIGGTYYFYAFFVPEGEEFSDIIAKIKKGTLEPQSNIVVAKVTFSND